MVHAIDKMRLLREEETARLRPECFAHIRLAGTRLYRRGLRVLDWWHLHPRGDRPALARTRNGSANLAIGEESRNALTRGAARDACPGDSSLRKRRLFEQDVSGVSIGIRGSTSRSGDNMTTWAVYRTPALACERLHVNWQQFGRRIEVVQPIRARVTRRERPANSTDMRRLDQIARTACGCFQSIRTPRSRVMGSVFWIPVTALGAGSEFLPLELATAQEAN